MAAALSAKSPFVTPFGREREAETVKRAFKTGNSDFLTLHRVSVALYKSDSVDDSTTGLCWLARSFTDRWTRNLLPQELLIAHCAYYLHLPLRGALTERMMSDLVSDRGAPPTIPRAPHRRWICTAGVEGFSFTDQVANTVPAGASCRQQACGRSTARYELRRSWHVPKAADGRQLWPLPNISQ